LLEEGQSQQVGGSRGRAYDEDELCGLQVSDFIDHRPKNVLAGSFGGQVRLRGNLLFVHGEFVFPDELGLLLNQATSDSPTRLPYSIVKLRYVSNLVVLKAHSNI
jgi:hypothetical protein